MQPQLSSIASATTLMKQTNSIKEVKEQLLKSDLKSTAEATAHKPYSGGLFLPVFLNKNTKTDPPSFFSFQVIQIVEAGPWWGPWHFLKASKL